MQILSDNKEVHALTKDKLPSDGQMSQDQSDIVIEDSSSSCAHCLTKDLSENGTTIGQQPEQHQQFLVTAQKDGLKIEFASPGTQARRILVKSALDLTRSSSNASKLSSFVIQGKHALYGLLMEVALAKDHGHKTIDLDRAQLFGAPLQHLSQLVQSDFWDNLTKTLDMSNAGLINIDSKCKAEDPRPRIYIPHEEPEQYRYYSQIAVDMPELRLDVQSLPPGPITPEFIRDINDKPGVLALAMEQSTGEDGKPSLRALPYVVPGGRFNEMYGWDSYFETLGLLLNGRIDVCISMFKNLAFCIQHYGKILNANRSYYLGRSQPPFLTSMGLAIFEKMDKHSPATLDFLRFVVLTAFKEYYAVWMSEIRYNSETGLSRYQGEGVGFPPEVEPHHFDHIISVYSKKHNMTDDEFVRAYNSGDIQDSEISEYLRHDRAGRESGHDTTYRFVGRTANLATVDLNSCLYKYETDIAHILDTYFGGSIDVPVEFQVPGKPTTETASTWTDRAVTRRKAMDKYLWCQEKGMYLDYDVKEHVRMSYESVTTLWPLWAGAASQSQAEGLVLHAIPKFETHGGLVSTTMASRGELSESRPARQWDYPHGWAPHQILAWDGLRKYGFAKVAERLAYRWITMLLKTFSDFNGLVVEKYDVTRTDMSHVVEAEYGNQGSDFNSPSQTGFGWTNGSLIYGAAMLQSPCNTCKGDKK